MRAYNPYRTPILCIPIFPIVMFAITVSTSMMITIILTNILFITIITMFPSKI